MTPQAFIKAVPRGLGVAAGVVFLLLIALGNWQLQRLAWKQGLIRDMAQVEALPPVDVMDALRQPKPEWRNVRLGACRVPSGHLVYMHSELDGQPGYRVLTSCPVASGESLLVDLGFATDKTVGPVSDFMPVGRLRPFEKAGIVTPPNSRDADDWYWRSASDMGPALGARLRSDNFLVLNLKASGIAPVGLVQGALTAPLPNRHLEYALTWFALAGALAIMFAAFVMQKVRRP